MGLPCCPATTLRPEMESTVSQGVMCTTLGSPYGRVLTTGDSPSVRGAGPDPLPTSPLCLSPEHTGRPLRTPAPFLPSPPCERLRATPRLLGFIQGILT